MPSPTPRQRPAVQPQTNPRRSVCGKDAASARFTGLLPSALSPRPSAPNRTRNAAADAPGIRRKGPLDTTTAGPVSKLRHSIEPLNAAKIPHRIRGQAPWPGSPPAVRTKPRTPELRSPGMTAAEQTPLPDLPSIPEKASAPQKRPTSQYKFKPQSPTRPRTQPRPTPPETPPLHRTPQRR